MRKRSYRPQSPQTCLAFALLIVGGPAAGSSIGQLMERATVIRNARIIPMTGPPIEKGDILIKGNRIRQIGEQIDLPFADRLTAKTIDAAGKTITPGLIDAWSALGRIGPVASADATATVWDAYDPFALDELREALANGITTVYLDPGGTPGIKGLGVVIQLAANESGSIGKVLLNEAALCIDLGSGESTVSRMKTYQGVRKKFRAALEYRKSLETYEEDLKEYLEKLEERRKAKEKDKKAGDTKEEKTEEAKPKSDKPAEEKPAEEPKPEPKPEEEDKSFGQDRTGLNWVSALSESADEKQAEASDLQQPDRGRRGGRGAPPAGEPGKPGDDKDKKDEDELKKPAKPKFDPTSEMLLRAVDRKLSVRIEAHRSADILNALSLADEFNLDVALQGATEAYLLADSFGEAGFMRALPAGDARSLRELPPVVLGRTVRTDLYEPNEFRRHSERNPAILNEEGVRFAIGSGGEPRTTRFAAMNAQLALTQIPGTDDPAEADPTEFKTPPWLRAMTAEAASLLGVSNRVGRLRPGMRADLVIWSDDPSHATAFVEQVFVNGETAYQSTKN